MVTLPTPNKTPGDGAPADDINLVIEAINTLQSEVDNIPAGPQGPQGEPGTPGAQGANASVTVGSTNTGAAGSDAAVTNSGTAQNAIFNFTIPRGLKGDTGEQGPQGEIGPTGPAGDPSSLYGSPAEDLGTAAAGVSDFASRGDHVHNMPSAADVGAIATSARGAADGVASLDSGGKVPSSELPAIAITETFVVASEAAMLALTAQVGDVAIRTDVNLNFILATAPASTLANWKQLLSPPDAVTSVDGRTGVVTLSDLYDASGAAAAVASDLSDHEAATTTVHGISDTANLVYTADARLSDQRTPLDGSVTTAKIVDANVTNAKLENSAITINGSAVSLGGSTTIDALPSQTGHSGEFLSTDGSVASWEAVDALPVQTGNAGKFLTTDGSTASWDDVASSAYQTTAPASPVNGMIWVDSDG